MRFYNPLVLALIAAIMSAFGQVVLKWAMMRHREFELSFNKLVEVIFDFRLILGVSIYVFALLIWIYVLSKIPLSLAYPILAITYIFVPLLGYLIFKESINPIQLLGMVVIIVGIFIIGKTY